MFVVYPVNSGKLSEEIVDAQKIVEIIWPITIVKGAIVYGCLAEFYLYNECHAGIKKPRSHS